jgi:hypothetical protein
MKTMVNRQHRVTCAELVLLGKIHGDCATNKHENDRFGAAVSDRDDAGAFAGIGVAKNTQMIGVACK